VESLLGQLAGTVVYSTDHQLAPAHVVKPGETLDAIGQQYNVPWQLLAKINGIAAPEQVAPGHSLKVVPGPFSATVDLTRNQMTLMVDGRYAGKFPVSVPEGATLPPGDWVVVDKLAVPSPQSSQPASPVAATPGGVQRSVVLRNAAATAASPGTPVVIGSASSDSNPLVQSGETQATGQNTAPSRVVLSSADADEVADILSIGSRVVIRR
jgi:LysM repeat protein